MPARILSAAHGLAELARALTSWENVQTAVAQSPAPTPPLGASGGPGSQDASLPGRSFPCPRHMPVTHSEGREPRAPPAFRTHRPTYILSLLQGGAPRLQPLGKASQTVSPHTLQPRPTLNTNCSPSKASPDTHLSPSRVLDGTPSSD